MMLRCRCNGQDVALETAPDARAIDLLREGLGLTGVKEGCGAGECGACAVLVDGEVRLSCLMLAAQLEGRELVTVEGLGDADAPHPLQRAMAAEGAVQCGFCSPGVAVSGAALLRSTPRPTAEEVREALSGHLCRCGGYRQIERAVLRAAGEDA